MFCRISQIIIGCLLACLVLEGILRLTNHKEYAAEQVDPNTGLTVYRPHMNFTEETSCFANTTKINNFGFNARDFALTKPKNIFRIVVVGGSFVEGFQLPQEKNFARILEDKLNATATHSQKYEVIALGKSGNGVYLDLLYFWKYAAQLKPDLVINFATEYEITRDTPTTAPHPPRFDAQGIPLLDLPPPNGGVELWKNIQKNSKLLMMLYFRRVAVETAVQQFLAQPKFFGYPPTNLTQTATAPNNLPSEQLWSSEEKILEQFAALVQQTKAKFLLTTWFTSATTIDLQKNYLSHWTAIAAKNKFSYFDLTPAMTARTTTAQTPVWTCDDHWNFTGHQWAADILYNFLRANPQLLHL